MGETLLYRGWRISYDAKRPATGTWRAERHGVGLGNNSKASVMRMIDEKMKEAKPASERSAYDELRVALVTVGANRIRVEQVDTTSRSRMEFWTIPALASNTVRPRLVIVQVWEEHGAWDAYVPLRQHKTDLAIEELLYAPLEGGPKVVAGLVDMVKNVLTDSQLDHEHCGETIRSAIEPAELFVKHTEVDP